MNRILIDPAEMDGDRARLCDRRAVHVRTVLKAGRGDVLRIGLLDGPVGDGEVVSVDAESVVLVCRWGEVPPRPSIDLILAIPRPKALGRLWSSLASLGVGRITLVNAAKVEKPYFSTHWLESSVYRPLLIEGLEQAGDTHVPQVVVERQFKPFVQDRLDGLYGGWTRIVLDPSASGSLLRATLPRDRPLVIAIGPDGGWTKYELDMLTSHGFVSASLGPRVLRTETACIAALAMAGDNISMASRQCLPCRALPSYHCPCPVVRGSRGEVLP
jgi:RsmE family RNA methyltransferase